MYFQLNVAKENNFILHLYAVSLLLLSLSVKSSLFLQLYYLFPRQGNALTPKVVID